MVANGVREGLGGGREDELHAGVEKLEEELGQPLDRRRARDDEKTQDVPSLARGQEAHAR
jgi:hypothetical protein